MAGRDPMNVCRLCANEIKEPTKNIFLDVLPGPSASWTTCHGQILEMFQIQTGLLWQMRAFKAQIVFVQDLLSLKLGVLRPQHELEPGTEETDVDKLLGNEEIKIEVPAEQQVSGTQIDPLYSYFEEDSQSQHSTVIILDQPVPSQSADESDVEQDDESIALPEEIVESVLEQPLINDHLHDMLRWLELLKCPECQEDHEHLSELISHMKEEHDIRKGSVTCCDRKFQLREILEHMQYHENKEAFKCDICGQNYMLRKTLNMHQACVHNSKSHACHLCGKKFGVKRMLRTHLKTHIPEKDRPFQCVYCGKGFVTKSQFQRHVSRRHEKGGNVICEVCGEGFSSKTILSGHMQNHAKKPVKKRRAKEPKAEKISLNLGPGKCTLCNTFVCNLAQHNRRTHPEQVKGKPRRRHQPIIFAEQSCQVCGRVFQTAQRLKVHMHMHSGAPRVDCPFCEFKPKTAGNRLRHFKYSHPEEYEKFKNTGEISGIGTMVVL